jgi:hypothetical protein
LKNGKLFHSLAKSLIYRTRLRGLYHCREKTFKSPNGNGFSYFNKGKEMISKIELKLVAGAFLLCLSACQTMPYQGQAREVKKKPKESGVISLKENFRDEDRAIAEMKMNNNCAPNAVRILEEGEAVVGQKVLTDSRDTHRDNSQAQVGSLFGVPVMSGDAGGKDSSSSSTTVALKEWQISYQCDTAKKAKR